MDDAAERAPRPTTDESAEREARVAGGAGRNDPDDDRDIFGEAGLGMPPSDEPD